MEIVYVLHVQILFKDKKSYVHVHVHVKIIFMFFEKSRRHASNRVNPGGISHWYSMGGEYNILHVVI